MDTRHVCALITLCLGSLSNMKMVSAQEVGQSNAPAPRVPEAIFVNAVAGSGASFDPPLTETKAPATTHVQSPGIKGGIRSAIGASFTYQGQLKVSGVPAATPYDFRFTLTDDTGTMVPGTTTVCKDNVLCTGGLFTVDLDFGAQFPGDARELLIEVRPAAEGDCSLLTGFVTLAPRQKLTSSPYALGLKLPFAGATNYSDILRGVISMNNTAPLGINYGLSGILRNAAGYVPALGAGVFGSASDANGVAGFSDSKLGVYGLSQTGVAVYGECLGNNDAVQGLTSGVNRSGVLGRNNATTGTTYGVYGWADSTDGRGILGAAFATTGQTFGAYGESDSSSGTGVYGWATAASGTTYGVWGQSDSATGYGGYFTGTGTALRAESSATSGSIHSAIAKVASSQGDALFAQNTATGTSANLATDFNGVVGATDAAVGVGVFGLASTLSSNSTGVYGKNDAAGGRGVYGFATAAAGTTYGVWGKTNSTNGYAGYFEGNGYFSGKIGIGTTAPQEALSVNAGLNIDQANANIGVLSGATVLSFGSNSGEGIGSKRNAGGNVNGLDFYTSNTNRMAITNTGKVGIGSADPQAPLHILSPTGAPPGALAGANNGLLLGSNGTASYKWIQSYGGVLALNPVGNNVGIGTTTPTNPLEMASGAKCTAGGVWTNASDRNLKENFRAADAKAILQKVAGLPIQRWNYKNESSSIVHFGPTAQDFKAAFNLGADDKSIGTIDADGVALAAIQGLNQIVCEKETELKALRSEKDSQIADLTARLERLERNLANSSTLGQGR